MTATHLSRRAIFRLAGAATAVAAVTRPAAANATEIARFRARVGESFTISGDGVLGKAALVDVAPLSPRVRPPMALDGRAPFALVFEQTGGDRLEGGAYVFRSEQSGDAEMWMVSVFVDPDGGPHLEAVFN